LEAESLLVRETTGEVDKGYDEEGDKGDSDVHFNRKWKATSPQGPPRKKMAVRKILWNSLTRLNAV